MVNLLFVLAVVLILGLTILFGFLRGLGKTRIRGICVVSSAVLAVVLTVIFKNNMVSEEFANGTVATWLQDAGFAQAQELLAISSTLTDVLLKCIAALIAPVMCLAFFLVFLFVTWIVYLILALTLGARLKAHNERVKYPRTRAIIWGAVQGIVILMVVLMPFAAYMQLVPDTLQAVVDTQVAEGEAADELQKTLEDSQKGVGVLKVYNVLGGKALTGLMTNFEVGGEKTNLSNEIGSIASFACNITRLSGSKFTEYTSTEAAVFVAIADSFDDSVLLPTIAGEIIYGATDSWLNGEAFLGAAMPSVGGDMQDVVDPFVKALFGVLHDDARNHPALKADIHTIAEMIATLAENGVFEDFQDVDALMASLGGEGVVDALVNTLGNNDNMKVLIPEITNMGVRAVAKTLKIPTDMNEVYGDFLTDVTGALNSVKGKDEETQVKELSDKLTAAFDEAGIPVNREIIDCYSISMMKDLLEAAGGRDLTVNDVQAFFVNYDMNSTVASAASSEPLSHRDPYAGTVYEGKTEEELSRTGAAALAKATHRLSGLQESESIGTEATSVLVEVYLEVAGESTVLKAKLEAVVVTKPVSSENIQATAGLKGVETVQSQRVTMKDLLVDTKEAAGKINADTLAGEVKMISGIFGAASSLKTTDATMDINSMSASMGVILNAMSASATYGAEQTAGLFTAVLQSETVRATAKIDVTTATRMAQKGTEGDVDYEKTMNTLSSGINVMTQLGKSDGEASQEELRDMIRNINPQTAAMLEIYATPARLEQNGVPQKYSPISSELLSETFGYMADPNNTFTEDEYEKEATALNHVLDIAMEAKSNKSNKLFSTETEKGVLPSADQTIHDILASASVSHSIRVTMLDGNGNVIEAKRDAYDLAKKIPQGSEDYAAYIAACDAAYADAPTEETALTLKALSALLGVNYTV